jgi:hypothetical protein
MPGSSDRATMSRGLALLFGAGATLVAITLVLPHGHNEAQLGLLIPVGAAYAVVALLLTTPKRWSPDVLHAILAAGTLLVGLCVIYGGHAGAAYAFMYVWVALYASAFFTVRRTAAHLAWAAASYAGVLAISGDVHPPPAQWLMAVGTSAVAATLILQLSRQLRGRANDLAAVTLLANALGASSEVSGETMAAAVCDAVLTSTEAASVVLLEEVSDGSGLHVLGMGGDPDAALAFDGADGIEMLDQSYRTGEPRRLMVDAAGHAGTIAGLVYPVHREGRVAGLLALVWARPRRRLGEAIERSTALYAAEAGVALERVARQSREQERRALELNDEIVQGLVVAKYALRNGRVEMGEQAIDETLERARALVDGQLETLHGREAPEPGSLRRRTGTIG